MNERKVAFILCMSNEREYSECKRYLDRLIVPEGFEMDVITIQEAPSMCAGYNAGMHSTDAKYKVYIHQDTFIINKNFIADMLKVFEDENVGLMGVIGARKLPKNAYAVTAWDTGKVYHNSYDARIFGYQQKGKIYTEVEAVDGLLLATQYDVEFREDLFENFDFYDISACFEYRRAGFKVVTANQDECWVYHNDKFSKMTKYDTNREKFVNEYKIDFSLEDSVNAIDNQEYELAKLEARSSFEKLIDAGQMAAVSSAIMAQESSFLCLRDIEILARIYANEHERNAFDWNLGINNLYDTLNDLKWFLKRVEYNVEMPDKEYVYYCDGYSFHSILMVALSYCIRIKDVVEKIRKYIKNTNEVEAVINKLPNDKSWLDIITQVESNIVYNLDKVNESTAIPVAISDLGKSDIVEIMVETFEKLGILDNIIIIGEKDGIGSNILKEKNVPIIIIRSMDMVRFCMHKNWDIKEAIFVEENNFIDECKRVFYNSSIAIKDILKCISDAYKTDDYRLYFYMSKILKRKNSIQAKLCMEQALYYCKQENDKSMLMDELLEYKNVCVEGTSVVILSYNTKDMTKRCIESLEEYTDNKRLEIIVIDNGSTDGSVECLQGMSEIKLVVNENNKGFAGGCNQGIELATKENDIWLLNSDTLVPKNALFWLKMGLHSNENVGATGSVSNFCPNYQNIVEGDVVDKDYEKVALKYNIYKENPLEEKNWLVGFSMLIKREALEKTGYLDERFFPGNFEDNDLSYRLLENSYKLMLCHNSFVFHYGGTSFKKSNTVSSSLVENKQRFINKWNFDPEKYTAIKTRHISMIDKNEDDEFSVIDLNAGVGATISRLKYKYKNAYVMGVEGCEEAAKIARLNGCKVCNDVDRYFDYVLVDGVSTETLEDVLMCIKYNGVLIGSINNKYYSELMKNNDESSLTANEIIEKLINRGFDVKDFSFAKGINYDTKDVKRLSEKYGCDEKIIMAERFYFVAKLKSLNER